ncbi:hypothetical protein PG996_009729 [Apiospora saccharicola]|uniref:Uncharacterized protein n=1 Tax=Apiospora saccharicola TaxID=335842 RepID=A0ABR1ULL5_9PEZI
MSHVTYVGRYIFFPLTYQSQDISFTKWVTLLTLGLAPLIAHILAGTPRASYLSKRRPKWHEQFVHYNPKSILWRYAAIADRRIRARNWGRADIAAANAIFWTSEGWDGSEAMVDRSLPYCTHIPDHARIAVFSGEMVKTLVVTLQGTQAVFALTSSLASGTYNDGFDRSMAVDFIFSPLAFIGLLWVFCALWLTDDFNYTAKHPAHHSTSLLQISPGYEPTRRNSMDSLIDSPSDGLPLSGHRYRSTSLWYSRAFRALYLLLLLVMLTAALMFLIGFSPTDMRFPTIGFTATSFTMLLFYIFFLAATSVICGVYFAAGSSSTVLPCNTAPWYKLYTAAIMTIGLVTLIISCLETHQTPCGKFTTVPGLNGDYYACDTLSQTTVPLGRDDSKFFGISGTRTWGLGENYTLHSGESLVYNVTEGGKR